MKKITIEFGFVDLFSFQFLLNIMSSFIIIIGNLFIIKSGKNQPEDVKFSKLLVIAGIINIIFEIMGYFIPVVTSIVFFYSTPNAPEAQIFLSYYIFRSCLFGIPSIITYGVFFIIIGLQNRKKFGIYLLIVGILETFSVSISIIYLNGKIFEYFFIFEGIPVIIISIQFIIYSNIVGIPVLFSCIFLIIHGKKNNDKYLIYAGIIRIIEFVSLLFIGIILNLITGGGT